MGTKNVHLHYCQIADEHCPLAITRFTSFDMDDKPLAVEQVTYESNMDYMERQVINALRLQRRSQHPYFNTNSRV